MASERPVVVVSGFEPFNGLDRNPSGDIVRALGRRAGWAAARGVVPIVLPVTYGGAFTVLAARALREQARGSLMFGLGRGPAMHVERCAYNAMAAPVADNAGLLVQDAPIAPGGPEVLATRAPHEAVLAALEAAGADAAPSDDPGRFVCNATYYRMLAARAPWSQRALFVHVPPTTALGGAVDDATLTRWIECAIDAYCAAI